MSEVSIIKSGRKKGIRIQGKEILICSLGLCAGSFPSDQVFKILSFCLLGYFVQKSIQETCEFVLFFLVGSFFQSTLMLYQDFLVLLLMGLLVLFVRVIHANLYYAMPWITAILGFLMMLVTRSNFQDAIQCAFVSYLVMQQCSSKTILVSREFRLSEMMIVLIMLVFTARISLLIEPNQSLFLATFVLLIVSLFFESQQVFLCFGLIWWIFQFNVKPLPWLLSACFVHYFKSKHNGLLIGFPILIYTSTGSLLNAMMALLIIALVLCLPQKEEWGFVEVEQKDHLLKMRLRNKEQLLQHQLNQFAQIFDTIVDYYEEMNYKETYFLKGMSESLSSLSMKLKQCTYSSEDEAYVIMERLKGLHLDVQRVYVSQNDVGVRRIIMDVVDCVRSDVDDVILPVLQVEIDRHLKLISYRKKEKFSFVTRLEFAGEVPLGMKAKAYRVLDEQKTSGDTCSIFEWNHMTICTLSDGMGIGEKAQKASGFVTYLTQRLLACSMPIEMVVKCVNSLCMLTPSESFATLDVCCFDALNHRLVISKNGAAPSYLIRGKEVIKIEGHALPLGIITQISADCYALDVMKQDVFLMCSDGVDEALVKEWVRVPKKINETVEKSIKACEKRDDISVIVMEIV